MSSQITIQGSSTDQARILKRLQSFGLVNGKSEITPTAADSFDTYNTCQERFIAILEEETKQKSERLAKYHKDLQNHFRELLELRRQNDTLIQSNEAKSQVNTVLQATIRERNQNIDDIEAQVLMLERKIQSQEARFEQNMNQMVESRISNFKNRYQEVEETYEEMERNQKRLSEKILVLKKENKILKAENDYAKKRMELSGKHQEQLEKNSRALKGCREEEEKVEEQGSHEIQEADERVQDDSKRRKLK